MKKYKNNNSFKEVFRRYRYSFFLSYLLLYSILSVLLGVLVFIAFSNVYLQNAKDNINKFIIRVTSDNATLTSYAPNDSRMVAIYFMKEPDHEDQLYYQVYGVNISSQPEEFQIFSSDATNNFAYVNDYYEISINGNDYIVHLHQLTDTNFQINGDDVGYIKVYMNVQSEKDSRVILINTYIILSMVTLVFAIIIGVFASKRGMRPLEEIVKKQLDFVSDASHELRTPLAVVQSKIENTLTDPDATIYDVSESLVIALNEINRLNKLTQELLTLARNDKDIIELNFEVINVNEVVKSIVEPFFEIAMLQEKTLEYNGIDCYAYLDSDKLKQILIANIDNALKYTNENDTIKISLRRNATDVIIEIADSGIGINEETKKHIFERFYREDKARSRASGGNGLGLSIAYALVSLQHGKISVDHNTPKGTKFTIVFPRVAKKTKNEGLN